MKPQLGFSPIGFSKSLTVLLLVFSFLKNIGAQPVPDGTECPAWGLCAFNDGYNVFFQWNTYPGALSYILKIRKVGDFAYSDFPSQWQFASLQLPPAVYEWTVFADMNGQVVDLGCTKKFRLDCASFDFEMTIQQPDFYNDRGFVRFSNFTGNFAYPFDFHITNGTDSYFQPNKRQHRFKSIAPGNYQVTITDAYGCTATDTFVMHELPGDYVPHIYKVANFGANGFEVRWNTVKNVPGTILKYQASYRNKSISGQRSFGTTIPAVDSAYSFSNLTPGFTYSFYVRSRYEDGEGPLFSPWSAPSDRFLEGSTSRVFVGGNEDGGTNVFVTNSLAVYPNPVEDILIVQSAGGAAEVQLFDVSGKIIWQGDFDESKTEKIDLSNLQSGMYLLKVVESQNSYTETIVKK